MMIGVIASLGIDFGVLNAMNLWVTHTRTSEAGQLELVGSVFHEDRPDLGEIKTVSSEVVCKLPEGVGQVLMPWTNYDRMESLWLWHAWLRDDHLYASTSSQGSPASVALDGAPSRLVRPALSDASGELDVFFVSTNGRELGMACFQPDDTGEAAKGSVAWRVGVGGAPVAARAALGPANRGSPKAVLLARQADEGLRLELFTMGGGVQPARPRAVLAEGVTPIPGSEPGLRIDEEGVIHASVLVFTDATKLDLAIVDAVFPADDRPPRKPVLTPIRTLETPPVAGGIAFQARPDRPMRRDWVVLLADGTILHNMSGEELMRSDGVPVVPLSLVALSQATYVLTSGAEGPELEALR